MTAVLLPSFRNALAQAPPALRMLLAAVEARLADDPLYLVGGVVRDLLRESQPDDALALTDLDLVLETDPAPIAHAAADRVNAELVVHAEFGTATLILGDARIDLARSRHERYRAPGALPDVEPAPITEDLARRDFTVNAMALPLRGPRAGTLLDPFGGERDLQRGWVRVLHDASFRDDPTRLLRACRYAARIDGRFAPATARAARRDRSFLPRLTAPRFGDAWRLLVADAAAPGALGHAQRLRLPQTWLPGWSLPALLRHAYAPDTARAWQLEPGPFYWALSGLTAPRALPLDALPARCALTRGERRALLGGRDLRDARPTLARRDLPPSRVAARFRPQPRAVLAAAYTVWTGVAGHRVDTFLDTWSHRRSPLDAQALMRIGVAPGPALGRWLDELRDAVLDGELEPGDVAAAERRVRSALGRGLQSPPGSESAP